MLAPNPVVRFAGLGLSGFGLLTRLFHYLLVFGTGRTCIRGFRLLNA